MESFDLVAMGGTFDIIHSGHMALLNKAFSISTKVIIGVTSDQLAVKKGKNPENDYSKRMSLLKSTIEENFQIRHMK
jgi:pantetheine-phosphate adenylyltransferase